MSAARFKAWAGPLPGEYSTHAGLREIPLPGAGTFALITIADSNARKPATFSPGSLLELGTLLEGVKQRAASGDFTGVGITGHDDCFVAGAELKAIRDFNDPKSALMMAKLGHEVFDLLSNMNVPTFAFINGMAIGGGLEIALAAGYRSISSGTNAISLPEALLGLIPGWGGVYRLPRLIGPTNAVRVMIENPLGNNRVLNGRSAFELGIADVEMAHRDFLKQSLEWAARIITSDEERKHVEDRRAEKAATSADEWHAAISKGRAVVAGRTGNAAPAPLHLLDLLEKGQLLTQAESAELEANTLAELMQTTQFKDSVYGFLDLLQHRSKNPHGAPDVQLAQKVTKVGVIGAGLMASQLALLFARRLEVPVVMTDLDQGRLDKGIAYVHAEVDKLLAKKNITSNAASRLKELVTGSVSKDTFSDADFVIEAVYEELSLKKAVFAEMEKIVSKKCVLATNTSSLSVTELATGLMHPGRVVGFHLFNPVAVMPLLEIIRAYETSDEALATAFALSKELRKTPVLVKDAAGFVVNRVLLRLLGEVVNAFDDGTPADVADNALATMGLPMTPFALLDMIGIPVAYHATESLQTAFGKRFRLSNNLRKLIDSGITSLRVTDKDGNRFIPQSTLNLLTFGGSPITYEQLLENVQDALAEEIGCLLEEGVVPTPEDVDLCMLTGAGWPLHLGGITPYLDRVGASKRVNGKQFRSP